MRDFDKTQLHTHILAMRIPYVTNSLLAFLLASGMTIQDISRASGLSRKALLRYQLSSHAGKKATRRLARCVSQLIAGARDTRRLGERDKYTHLYHDHLDTYIAWGEYIIKQERNKHND